MNILIVAGGLGTRFKELSCFPKILLPTKEKDSILLEQLEYFKNDDVTIIINEKYYKMLLNYVEVNNLNVRVVSSSNINGSGNTIASVYEMIPKKNVLIFWSDIVFERNTFERSGGFRKPSADVVIYTSEEFKYRYSINNGIIKNVSDTYNGNIPGVFFIKDLNKIIPIVSKDEKDLVDFLIEAQQDGFIKEIIEESLPANIIEYKSIEDYKEILSQNEYKKAFQRLNNQWVIDNDFVVEPNQISDMQEQMNWSITRSMLNNDTFKIYYNAKSNKFAFNSQEISDYKLYCNCSEEVQQNALDQLLKIIQNEELIQLKVDNEVVVYEVDKFITQSNLAINSVKNLFINYSEDLENKICYISEYISNYFQSTDYLSLSATHQNINESTILVNEYTGDVKLIHHKDMTNYFGVYSFDLAAYYRIKCGIDKLLRIPIVYMNNKCGKEIENNFKAFDSNIFNEIPLIYRLINILFVMTQLPILATDVMKVNIMLNWITFEINNIKNTYSQFS